MGIKHEQHTNHCLTTQCHSGCRLSHWHPRFASCKRPTCKGPGAANAILASTQRSSGIFDRQTICNSGEFHALCISRRAGPMHRSESVLCSGYRAAASALNRDAVRPADLEWPSRRAVGKRMLHRRYMKGTLITRREDPWRAQGRRPATTGTCHTP
jgi:hypothetical protein